MAQTISVVVPVYDGVTQLDFTGPHQVLSRTPDVQVRVAWLDGRPDTAPAEVLEAVNARQAAGRAERRARFNAWAAAHRAVQAA